MSGKDYRKLYQLQDKFFAWWKGKNYPFYLTGGTALGRFILHHRFSEDLDFFANALPDYKEIMQGIFNEIKKAFVIDTGTIIFADDFTRMFITEDGNQLKIEFVNDVAARNGIPTEASFGLVDCPLNILTNKLSALIGRDEPKDVYDIIALASAYSFSWSEIVTLAKEKTMLNEIEVEAKLSSFPFELLEKVDWLHTPEDKEILKAKLTQISNEILLGSTNSLGKDKPSIF